MCEQTLEWKSSFEGVSPCEGVSLTECFIEQWGENKTIFPSSKTALIVSRGNYELGRFIMFENEMVFRLDNGVKLSTSLIQRYAFLE